MTETTFNVEKFKYTNSALRSAPAYSCVSGRKEKLDSRRSYPGPGAHTFETRELIALKPKAELLGKAAFVTESGLGRSANDSTKASGPAISIQASVRTVHGGGRRGRRARCLSVRLQRSSMQVRKSAHAP